MDKEALDSLLFPAQQEAQQEERGAVILALTEEGEWYATGCWIGENESPQSLEAEFDLENVGLVLHQVVAVYEGGKLIR